MSTGTRRVLVGMKRMIGGLALALVLLLAACGSGPTPAPTPTPTLPILERPTETIRQFTILPSAIPPTETISPTASPSPLPCDAQQAYCIEEGHFLLDRPIALQGNLTIDPGYPYGSTEGGTRDPHHGVEFNNASGTPVLAAADGQVVVAGTDNQDNYALNPNTYGNLIVIEHHFPGFDQPIFTLYGHLSLVEVTPGQEINDGDEIGQVGSTGVAVGSHLHFEVRLGQDNYDSNRNPVLWLKKPLNQTNPLSALAGRLEDAQGKLVHASGLNIQYFPDPNGPQSAAWQVETYAPERHPVQGDDSLHENFALGDLQPGNYRISLMWGGKLYERMIVLEPDKLTFFILQLDH